MNKKGFTIIEFLAIVIVVTALFILIVPNIIEYKEENQNTHNKNLEEKIVIAALNYYSDNKDKLEVEQPKIKISELIKQGYLTKNITDIKGNSCIKKSYVFVTKTENKDIKYNACIMCENTTDDSISYNLITKENCLK